MPARKSSEVVARVLTAEQIRTARATMSLSQAGLAQRLGVDVMTVSRWERGESVAPAMLPLALAFIVQS